MSHHGTLGILSARGIECFSMCFRFENVTHCFTIRSFPEIPPWLTPVCNCQSIPWHLASNQISPHIVRCLEFEVTSRTQSLTGVDVVGISLQFLTRVKWSHPGWTWCMLRWCIFSRTSESLCHHWSNVLAYAATIEMAQEEFVPQSLVCVISNFAEKIKRFTSLQSPNRCSVLSCYCI